MQTAEIIQIQDSAREKILESAFQRFRHYGYSKTTMAEIAEDCGMSAANIYRHFENKQEIATCCVEQCICERLEIIRESINQDGLSATDKLRHLTITSLRHVHQVYSRDAKINELIGFIAAERPEVANNKIQLVQNEIKNILEFGNQSGEFNLDDTEAKARAIYSTIALFDTPVFIGFYSLEQYEAMANEVLDLIFHGLIKR